MPEFPGVFAAGMPREAGVCSPAAPRNDKAYHCGHPMDINRLRTRQSLRLSRRRNTASREQTRHNMCSWGTFINTR